MARPRKIATDTAPRKVKPSLLEKYKDFPGIKVLERRFDHPDLPGSLPIRLKDEPTHIDDPTGVKRMWYVRWINAGEPGRYSAVVDGMGYVPVKIDELQNAEGVAGLHHAGDGIVRRGDKGTEVLCKMPLELYTEIKRRQHARRDRRAKNANLVRQELAESAGRSLGDEAGDFVDGLKVSVTQHHTSLGDELDGRTEVDEA